MVRVARIENEKAPLSGARGPGLSRSAWYDLPNPQCEGGVDMHDWMVCAVGSPRQAAMWWPEDSIDDAAADHGMVCAVYEVEEHSTHFLPKQIVFDTRTATRVAVYPPTKMLDLEFIGSVLQPSAAEN